MISLLKWYSVSEATNCDLSFQCLIRILLIKNSEMLVLGHKG